jgi:ATP-dependent Clp protease ATP-binding subunit ClpA
MHPFERLSPHARQALDLARRHALDEGRDEIDTGDLAWALLHQTDGGAAVVLARLRVSSEPPPPGYGRGVPEKRRPGVTARMKDAIRRAYEEAADADARHVGSEHLLLGLLEADPDASSTLGEQVMTADLVRMQIHQWMRVLRFPTGAILARSHPGFGAELFGLSRQAERVAAKGAESSVLLTHLLHAMGESAQLRAAAILLDRLGGAARPPGAAMELLWALEDVQRRREDARREGDEDAVERLSGEEARLQGEVHRALSAWHRGLCGGREDEGGARREAAAPH